MDRAHFQRKHLGAYYTPEAAAATLVRWVVRSPQDRLLDPACGDGRFLVHHRRSVGVEQDPSALSAARHRVPWAAVHEGDFFSWALQTSLRFECAAGNPPFIRYQRFSGAVRTTALRACAALGVQFSGLSSSWAPFIAMTASLLKPGGRMAFVVPAEIGHAPYARPLLSHLLRSFGRVHVIALRDKLFPELSEDCWLLVAEDRGAEASSIVLSAKLHFAASSLPPTDGIVVDRPSLDRWGWRLRPFLTSPDVRALYRDIVDSGRAVRLGEVAKVGIGYVTGDNDFFHLSPSEAVRHGISDAFLHPTVRSGRFLQDGWVTKSTVAKWKRQDEKVFLLRLAPNAKPPAAVRKYLESPAGDAARASYKCRMRDPWYSVPDVAVPHAFLSYMSSSAPTLVGNAAKCTCTNSIHLVRLVKPASLGPLLRAWRTSFASLSCELEGHPLGGGMLKLEPREAAQVAMPRHGVSPDAEIVAKGIRELREWRHYDHPACM